MKYIGAHVSIAGGVENAPLNAVEIGAKGFALFTKNQRQWLAPPLKDDMIAAFKHNCRENGYSAEMILPHDSYLINLGQPDKDKREKSIEAFTEELRRCEALGLKYLNFHPGSHLKLISVEECLALVADSINRALAETDSAIAVIENTAGQGSNVGSSFEEIARIIEQVKDKKRVGVCLDTCHAFAAGYDLRSDEGYDATMGQFDRVIGFEFLCGMHLNDSKGELGGRLDRHESIGRGKLGLEVFRRIMHDSRIDNIPLTLETPDDTLWREEIKLLAAMAEQEAF